MDFNKMFDKIKKLNEDARTPLIVEYDEDEDNERQNIIDDLTSQYGEEFYQPTLPEDEKINRPKYSGKNVTWYGMAGMSIVVPIENVYSREGNVFNDDKTAYLTELLENYPDKIELTPGFVTVHVSNIEYVKELQQYKADGDPSLDTTGDESLDEYAGLYEDYEFEEYFGLDSDYDYIVTLLNETHLKLGKKEVMLDDFINKVKVLVNENGGDFDEIESAINLYLEMEEGIMDAIENKEGTLGELLFQMRDGNHRFQAAKAVGETEMLVIIEDNELQSRGPEFFEKHGYQIV